MTLPTISQRWVHGSVTKNQLSKTVLLTPALLWRELQQPVHSRFHRAREREMLYRLGVTGCGSRVALSEMYSFPRTTTRCSVICAIKLRLRLSAF